MARKQRATLAVLLSIVLFFIGLIAVSNAAQSSKDTAMNSSQASADAWNATTGVWDGLGQTAGPAVAIAGIAAVVLISLGFLVTAGRSGR